MVKGIAKFDSVEAFLEWLDRVGVEFPFLGGEGWMVIIDQNGVRITSKHYEVRGDPKGYGAPKPHGHLFPLGENEEMVSGLVEIGPEGEVLNRRSVVSDDRLDDNQRILKVVITQPDRVVEPVAVIVSGTLDDYSMNPKAWNKATLNARDGVELAAIQAVMAWVFAE